MPRPLFITGLLILALPVLAEAAYYKAPRPSHADIMQLHASSSSSKRSSSSATSTVSMNDWSMKIGFQLPKGWQKRTESTDYFIAQHLRDIVPEALTSRIIVRQDRLEKERTPAALWKWFIHRALLEPTADTLGDWYIPSFGFTASGTTRVVGRDALTVQSIGIRQGSGVMRREVLFATDSWLYSIWSESLPDYAVEDGKAFDTAIATFTFTGARSSSFSSSSLGRARRRR